MLKGGAPSRDWEPRKITYYVDGKWMGEVDDNVGRLLKLASPRYYEDGGNTNPEDDIDFDDNDDGDFTDVVNLSGEVWTIENVTPQ